MCLMRAIVVGTPSAAMATLTCPKAFLACVRKSQLVTEEQLAPWLQAIGAEGDCPPEELAGRLVRDGFLSEFQARQLLEGRWQGFLLGGKYRILELLGAGGVGQVFLCEHTRLHLPMAVKVLRPDHSADPATLARFHREARAAFTLSHPNLVRAFDADEDGPFTYLVMEYVHGQSLFRLVQERGMLPLGFAVACVRQAALGLQHAHAHGLVHRDVKPGNILLSHQGTIKVVDLGLARYFHDDGDQVTGEHDGKRILGTADYMAPEQALDSHQVTHLADVYSLGATFYFLLAGKPPFGGRSIAQKVLWHQIRQPPPLRSWRDDVPAEVEAILFRMMAKDPAERFAALRDIAAALEPWNGPLPPPAAESLPKLSPLAHRLLEAATPPPAGAPAPGDPAGAPPSEEGRFDRDALVEHPLAWGRTGLPGPGQISPSLPPPPAWVNPAGRRRAPLRWLLAAGAGLLLAAGVWGGYLLSLVLLAPSVHHVPPPDLRQFDPLAGLKPHAVIPDYLAVGQVGQTRTVRLTVRGREHTPAGDVFLYSTRTHHDNPAKVFTLDIPHSALPEFKKAGIADPYAFYMGQTLDVRGTVKYLTADFTRPGIEVTEPEQVQLVKPD
jgi:serine/threonine protein kinase